MRLIDADELISNVFKNDISYNAFKNLVQRQPTVDAVPVVHGEWQWISSTYDRTPCEMKFRCSICHHEVIRHNAEPWEHYCPNCGASMDGKDGTE